MQRPSNLGTAWWHSVSALCVLAGCAAPTETPLQPLPAVPAAFKAAPVRDDTPIDTMLAEPVGTWWRIFDDAVLDDLMLRAERGNTELATAATRVAFAQAALRRAQAAGWPQLGAGTSAGRQGGPLVNAAGTEGTLFTAGVQLSYEVDLSRRLAADQDAATLDAQAREHQLRSARLLVQSQVAHAYLALRAADAERALAQQGLQARRQTLQIGEERLRQGSVAELDVLRQRVELQKAAAGALDLGRRRAELESTLAVLLGEVASGLAVAEVTNWSPRVPEIPSGIPSEVLVRRPDVAAAAKLLQAAHARTTGARRAWWPSLVLTATGGQASPTLGDLLHPSMRAFSIGALLAAPLFDGGRREAGVAQARADEDAALTYNRERVLTAFKEVEDQLVALRVLAAQADHYATAAEAAKRAAAISDSRWRNGLASHLELLDSQRSAWSSQAAVLQSQAARAQATVGLIRALGGGWGDVRVMGATPAQRPGS